MKRVECVRMLPLPKDLISKPLDQRRRGRDYLTAKVQNDAWHFYLHQLYYLKKVCPDKVGACLGGNYMDGRTPFTAGHPRMIANALVHKFGPQPLQLFPTEGLYQFSTVRARKPSKLHFDGQGFLKLVSPGTGELLTFENYSAQYGVPLDQLAKLYMTTIRETL